MSGRFFPYSFVGAWRIGDRELPIRGRPDHPDCLICAEMDGESYPADDVEELLAALPGSGPLRVEVTALFLSRGQVDPGSAGLELSAWLDERPRFVAAARLGGERVSGPESDDLEDALVGLVAALRPRGSLRLCVGCALSDYEPGTSFGHLYCFRESREGYLRLAGSGSAWARKYGIWGLKPFPEVVEELHSCEDFSPRPARFGYRG